MVNKMARDKKGGEGSYLLQGKRPLDNVLADIILLGQVEQLPDLGCSLGSKTEHKKNVNLLNCNRCPNLINLSRVINPPKTGLN